MTRGRATQTTLLACFAAAGLIGAHVLAYFIALPDAIVRSAVLRNTGHGYLGPAVVIATVALFFGIIGAAAVGYAHGRHGERSAVRWRHVALRIASTQTVAFLLLETAERGVAGRRPVAGDLTLLAVGVVVQALLGCIAAAVLTFVGRAAEFVGRTLRPRPSPLHGVRGRVRALFDVAAPRLQFAGAHSARAPPAPSR
jgi:hypothetical protein